MDIAAISVSKALLWHCVEIRSSHRVETLGCLGEQAAEKLAAEGIDAEVIDLRTLRPMDTATVIRSVMKTNRCVTVEEGWPVCSIGNHISAVLMQEAFDWLDAPVINCTGKDVPMPYAANLEKLALVTADEVVEAARKVTYR